MVPDVSYSIIWPLTGWSLKETFDIRQYSTCQPMLKKCLLLLINTLSHSNNQTIKYTQTLKHSNNQTNTQMLINAYKWSSVLENASKCLPHAYQRRKVPEESCSCLLMSAANEYCSGVTTYSIYFATICKTLSSSATRKKKHIKNKKQKN